MKNAKRFLAMLCVCVLIFTVGFRYIDLDQREAYAIGSLGGQAAGAWIAAGLVALNIVADVAIGSIGNYFGWQAHPTSTTLLQQDIQYTFPVASQYISDYMNAATIKVDQGVTTVDGVVYDELWVSPGTFTNGLKTNLFDFKSKWNILSGQADLELASGYGHIADVPVYSLGNTVRSQYFILPEGNSQVGVISNNLTTSISGSRKFYTNIVSLGQNSYTLGSSTVKSYDIASYIIKSGNNFLYRVGGLSSGGTISDTKEFTISQEYVNIEPFEYTYTSGIVPANESDIPSDYGLSIQIPHDQLQTFYNVYPQYNYDNSTINIQQDEVDIDALTQAIFDQITSMDQIKASWTDGEPEPEPEPEPVPPEPVPPEPAEDVLEGLNTIADQQYQSSQIQYQDYVIQQQQLQQQQQQLQQQQQINQNTNSIKETIQNVTQTPTANDLPDFKFDLREFFPFCIPFDIYNLLTTFDAEPVAPHVQIPFVIESLNFSYNIDLDFSVFDPVAQILRTVEFIVYALGLAWATGKVIKW